jgi:hypothetical protein
LLRRNNDDVGAKPLYLFQDLLSAAGGVIDRRDCTRDTESCAADQQA